MSWSPQKLPRSQETLRGIARYLQDGSAELTRIARNLESALKSTGDCRFRRPEFNVSFHHLTIDVEDWFHLLDTDAAPHLSTWHQLPGRVEASTRALLELLDQEGVRATFFVLGWVAARYPALVREIGERGHEIGSHGWGHVLVDRLTRDAFRDDVVRSIEAIAAATGSPPAGFRAAGFSITPTVSWAFEVLAELGFRYDASVFPAAHGHGGFPVRSLAPFSWELSNGTRLVEFPVAAIRAFGRTVPFGGGGYFRLLPVGLTAGCMRWLEHREIPATLYLHPREIDPDHPRLPGLSAKRRFKSYFNLHSTESKLRYILRSFSFHPLNEAHCDAFPVVKVPA